MEADYKSQHILPIVLDDDVKVEHENEWRTYHERKSVLEKQRGQSFSMIRGQCMQVILDQIKHDPDWYNTSEP